MEGIYKAIIVVAVVSAIGVGVFYFYAQEADTSLTTPTCQEDTIYELSQRWLSENAGYNEGNCDYWEYTESTERDDQWFTHCVIEEDGSYGGWSCNIDKDSCKEGHNPYWRMQCRSTLVYGDTDPFDPTK